MLGEGGFRMKKTAMLLILFFTLVGARDAFATGAFVPNDAYQGPAIVQGQADDTDDALPVQDQGIITLEARRTFGGTLPYVIEGRAVEIKWNAGVAYAQARDTLGALRHVWVHTQTPGAEVEAFEYRYSRTDSRDAATLTLSFTVACDGRRHAFVETFTILPDGDGASVERVLEKP